MTNYKIRLVRHQIEILRETPVRTELWRDEECVIVHYFDAEENALAYVQYTLDVLQYDSGGQCTVENEYGKVS